MLCKADAVIADLPYGTTVNKWDSVIPLPSLWEQYRRLLSPTGTVVLTSQGLFTARLLLSNEDWFKYKIVWEKSKATNFLNAKKQPLRKHEDVCVFAPGRGVYNPQMKNGDAYDKGVRKDQQTGSYGEFKPSRVKSDGQRYPTDVVYFKTAESEPERKVWHGTQKPVALMTYIVRTYSNIGDVVLDNAMGVGTTGIACLREGRRFVGIEKDPAFFDIACQRIEAAARALPERIAA
jgi:site-specific DNA-methyltransferase (adenine-specific)/modification methylase